MKYQFNCSKCDEVKTLDMSIQEYEKFDSKCLDCGESMDRVFNCAGLVGSSDVETNLSCSSGGCASCSGCSGCA